MSAQQPVEVRQCPKCQAPAVTLVFTWTHTTWGANTGQFTNEYRCQQCGAKFVSRPRAQIVGLFIAGAILTLSCVGFPMLFVAYRRWTVMNRIPLAPGAPPPLIRFRGGPPLRTCGECSGTATAVKITRHTHNGIPTGTEYEYLCASCKRQFTVESPLGQIFSALGGLLLAGGAVAFIVAGPTIPWKAGGGAVCSLLAFFLLAQVVKRLMNRVRNPAQSDAMTAIG